MELELKELEFKLEEERKKNREIVSYFVKELNKTYMLYNQKIIKYIDRINELEKNIEKNSQIHSFSPIPQRKQPNNSKLLPPIKTFTPLPPIKAFTPLSPIKAFTPLPPIKTFTPLPPLKPFTPPQPVNSKNLPPLKPFTPSLKSLPPLKSFTPKK